jgi:hypothetical protein
LTKARLLICVLLFSSLPTFAQKAAIFGGYQLTRRGGDALFGAGTSYLNGWNASVTGGVAPFLGITADLSGAYKSGSKLHTFSVGPELRAHVRGLRPFGHILVGGYSSSGPISLGSTSGFAMFAGGGLDIKAAPLLAIRIAQFDWMMIHSQSSSNNFRYSAGLVLSF